MYVKSQNILHTKGPTEAQNNLIITFIPNAWPEVP